MKRMHEVLGLKATEERKLGVGDEETVRQVVVGIGDVRVRVDLAALAFALGPSAITGRGHRVERFNGALVVEAFNIRKPEAQS